MGRRSYIDINGSQLFTLAPCLVRMGFSKRCPDLKTHWNSVFLRCVLCITKPGYEITPNCGFDDDGGRHVSSFTKCKENTFNDGSGAYCQPCTPCPPGHEIVNFCNTTTDTKCEDPRNRMTAAPVTIQTNQRSSLTPNATAIPTVLYADPAHPDVMWAAPLAILISVMLVVLSACVVYLKRKRGQSTVLNYNRRSSYINAGFSPLSALPGNNDVEDILSPKILSAPLQTVLDNLDVLEELVILLDPESHGLKNTKHLASHCSFPSTWINYTYSMKDSKSPLKAVLEGVTSRQPDWTVEHLAKLLRHMERNDAIAVLAKLRLNEKEV